MSGPGRLLGSGRRAEVFARDGRVVKLYAAGSPKQEAFREAAILALVEACGLPVPAVRGVVESGGRWGVEMDLAPPPTLGDALLAAPAEAAAGLRRMAGLHRRIHAVRAPALAALPPLRARLVRDIGAAPLPDPAWRATLLERLAGMPDGDGLCHGDFHPFNIMGPPGAEQVIDWVDASRGDPLADACRSFVLMRPRAPVVADAYLDAYAALAGIDPADILGWLPFVAAARLADVPPDEFAAVLALAAPARGTPR